jgi:hypothetical protein
MIGLTREDGEDDESLSSRCHYRIDVLIRQHATQVGAHRIIELMHLHDTVERLAP